MEKKEIEKLIEKYQKKADAAELAYQETGERRYCTAQWTNQDLADTLRIALSAEETHDIFCEMKAELSNLASRGAAATSPLLPEDERVKLSLALAADIAAYGKLKNLI